MASEVQTGAMIALIPTDADARQLSVAGGLPPDELHCTLAYLGKADEYSADTRVRVEIMVRELVAFFGVIRGDGFAISAFNPKNPDKDPCIVIGLSGEQIGSIQRGVEDLLGNLPPGLKPPAHKPFIPHVTLAYTSDISKIVQWANRVGPITFDRVRVAWAGKNVDFPLTPFVLTASQKVESHVRIAITADGKLAVSTQDDGSWEGILAIEGIPTGDQRQFSLNSLSWPDTQAYNVPLMWAKSNEGAHKGSVVVGRIDEIWRDEDNPGMIRGRGRFDLGNPDGVEAHRQVEKGFLSGISIDPDQITDADIEMTFKPGAIDPENKEQSLADMLAPTPDLTVFHKGRVRGATLVAFPAFVEARIGLANQASSLTASVDVAEDVPTPLGELEPDWLVACGKMLEPPAEWFADPQLDGPTPLQVTKEGRVFGHAAQWGTCHVGFGGTCVSPPMEDDYGFFTTGEVLCVDGQSVPVGQITIGGPHAPTSGVTVAMAMDHYADTCTAVADVTAGSDAHGIWVSGYVRPGTDPEKIVALRASALSGDWRRIGGQMRMIGLLAVNVPGFAIRRTVASSNGKQQLALIAAGMVVAPTEESDTTHDIIMSLRESLGITPADKIAELRQRISGE